MLRFPRMCLLTVTDFSGYLKFATFVTDFETFVGPASLRLVLKREQRGNLHG